MENESKPAGESATPAPEYNRFAGVIAFKEHIYSKAKISVRQLDILIVAAVAAIIVLLIVGIAR
ncbi:MAG: hypothetical protein LBK41_08990 [Clostridiales bacterium]|nr:hypothetical protein [Clostridiales bacterium]